MNILAIGAHPDDIELMCGGALAYYAQQGESVYNIIVSNGGLGFAKKSVRRQEALDAAKIIGVKEVIFLDYFDGKVPCNIDIISKIENKISNIKPDIIFTHSPEDQHQDHRQVAQSVISAARRHRRVLLCESPSSYPHFDSFISLDITSVVDKKLEALKIYKSHLELRIDIQTIRALARYHGFQVNVKYAEIFKPYHYVINMID